MSFYTMVIVNPVSAGGATGRNWPELRSALDRVLERWDTEFTLKRDDATRLARKAVADGYEMIVSVGGDGTMNEVVTGLLAEGHGGLQPAVTRPGVVIGSVRAGTGGDFARLQGLPHHLPESVAHLAGDATKACDLGYTSITGHDGAEVRRAFLNIASFGLSGLVDEKVNTTTKVLGGKASFLIGTFRALASYKPLAVTVTVDGVPFLNDETMVTVAVANGQYFGGGMRIAPNAELDDGQLDVVVQLRSGLKEITSVGDLYSGKALDWASVRHTRGGLVEARPSEGTGPVLVDCDGEQPGRLPARFQILPSAVRLKVR